MPDLVRIPVHGELVESCIEDLAPGKDACSGSYDAVVEVVGKRVGVFQTALQGQEVLLGPHFLKKGKNLS